jgi:hypothetical protein
VGRDLGGNRRRIEVRRDRRWRFAALVLGAALVASCASAASPSLPGLGENSTPGGGQRVSPGATASDTGTGVDLHLAVRNASDQAGGPLQLPDNAMMTTDTGETYAMELDYSSPGVANLHPSYVFGSQELLFADALENGPYGPFPLPAGFTLCGIYDPLHLGRTLTTGTAIGSGSHPRALTVAGFPDLDLTASPPSSCPGSTIASAVPLPASVTLPLPDASQPSVLKLNRPVITKFAGPYGSDDVKVSGTLTNGSTTQQLPDYGFWIWGLTDSGYALKGAGGGGLGPGLTEVQTEEFNTQLGKVKYLVLEVPSANMVQVFAL